MSALAQSPEIAHKFACIEAERIYEALSTSPAGEHRDRLIHMLWVGVDAGAIGFGDAEFVQSSIDDFRTAERAVFAQGLPSGNYARRASKFATRRHARSPDREASRYRRRTLAGSAAMPPSMRSAYTQAQSSTLAIVVGEVKHHGVCDLPVDAIASLAGCSRTSAQDALRLAKRRGHVAITERPQRGAKNLTNLVQITSAEWRAWISRGPSAHRATGFKTPTANKNFSTTKSILKKRTAERSGRCLGTSIQMRSGERDFPQTYICRDDSQRLRGDPAALAGSPAIVAAEAAMKRKNIAPTTRRNEHWIACGSPEYQAWTAQARADGRSIPEYRSAITGMTGFLAAFEVPAGTCARASSRSGAAICF